MKYLILPRRTPYGKEELFVDTWIDKIKAMLLFKNKYVVYSVADNFIYNRWGKNLLKKYGDIHFIEGDDLMSYYKYWASYSRDFPYYYYNVKCNHLDSKNLYSDMIAYLKMKNYKVVIPPRRVRISLNRYINYIENKLVVLQPMRFLSLIVCQLNKMLFTYFYNIKKKLNQRKTVETLFGVLKDDGFTKIQLINSVENSSSGAIYFDCFYGEQRSFVKAIDYTLSLNNEIICLELLNKYANNNYYFPIKWRKDCYIAYEYADNITLNDILSQRTLSQRELNKFISFANSVLDELNKLKIVHSDVRPENIMVELDGKEIVKFKLLDFGMAFVEGKDYSIHGRMRDIQYSYVGHSNRYSESVIDDAASFCSILFEMKIDCQLYRSIANKIGINYIEL